MSGDSAGFWLLHDLRGRGREDTEDMNRERAETYLRVRAEAELRRATRQPWGDAPQAGYAARVNRIAQVLAFVMLFKLGEDVPSEVTTAGSITDMFWFSAATTTENRNISASRAARAWSCAGRPGMSDPGHRVGP